MLGIRSSLRRLRGARPVEASAPPKESKWHLAPIGRTEGKAAHIEAACLLTRDLDGMIVECGVATAYTLSLFAHATLRSGDHRRIVGVDSFEGFPPGTEQDSPDFSPAKKAHYELFTVEFARGNLIRSGLTEAEADSVELVKGWIPAVFEAFEGPISILHVDVDLYQPYRDSLETLWPRLQKGGIVLFDEYDREDDEVKWPGAKKAVDEFCAERNLELRKHWSGFAYLVKQEE